MPGYLAPMIPHSSPAWTTFTKHLSSADFFDVEKFPTAKFESTSVVVSGQTAKITGDLTLHGVTKPVVLDAKFTGAGANPMSKAVTVGFANCATRCSRGAFDYLWPIIIDRTNGQCH